MGGYWPAGYAVTESCNATNLALAGFKHGSLSEQDIVPGAVEKMSEAMPLGRRPLS